jgi:hypothetical protein
MKVVEFKKGGSPDRLKNSLDTIDDLRKRVESGEIVAFAMVGVHPDDATSGWSSCTEKVSRLRMQGAIAQLLHSYSAGDLSDD